LTIHKTSEARRTPFRRCCVSLFRRTLRRDGEEQVISVLSQVIDLDLHASDIELLQKLIDRYHPEGMDLVDERYLADDKKDPAKNIPLPKALEEWVKAMSNKYHDRRFVLALTRKVLEKMGYFPQDPNDAPGPVYKEIH